MTPDRWSPAQIKILLDDHKGSFDQLRKALLESSIQSLMSLSTPTYQDDLKLFQTDHEGSQSAVCF